MVTRNDDEERRRLAALEEERRLAAGGAVGAGAVGTGAVGAGAYALEEERKRQSAAGRPLDEGKGLGADAYPLGAAKSLAAEVSLSDTAIAVTVGVVLFTVLGALLLFGVLAPPKTSIGVTKPPATTQVTPTAASAVTPTAAPTTATTAVVAVVPPVGEVLAVPFTVDSKTGVTTTKSYTGTTTVTVSGTGQTAQAHMSDAFYTYTDLNGQPLTPPIHETTRHSLCINGKPVDNFLIPNPSYVNSIPPYSPDHTYTFKIKAPGGPLSFAVCDSVYSNNTGSYTVTVS